MSVSFRFGVAFVRVALGAAAVATAAPAHAGIGVSGNGQATYGHAISVPPGIAGMAPNLSLAYTEGGINGPVGVGWSVQGISTITRCGASRPTDGAARAVDFSAADKLCLDGQRLIQTDAAGAVLATQQNDALGLSGSAVREFRTEKDSFARIRAYGQINASVAADGPAYIKVWTKSGQLYEYGLNPGNSDANAVVTAQGRTAVMVWAVRRISDTVGNYIDFRYTQGDVNWGSGTAAGGAPGREWNVAEIQYTGTASSAARNKVVFSYDTRASDAAPAYDRAEAYQLNNKNVSTQRLSAIRTYINSPNVTQSGPDASTAVAVRAYKLTYDRSTSSGRSRLTQITECVGAAETQCLPPVSLAYTAGGSPDFAANATFAGATLGTTKMIEPSTGNYGVLTGDFNGDGRTDILRWSNTPGENQLWFSSGGGAFTQVAAATFNLTTQNLFKTDGCYSSMVADFNGDGLSDILRTAKASCSGAVSNLYLSNGDGSFTTKAVSSAIDFSLVKPTSTSYYFNGNCPDIERMPSPRSTAAQRVRPSIDNFGPASEAQVVPEPRPTRATPTMGGTCTRYARSLGHRYYILDLNGDGILDIVTTVAPNYVWWSWQGPLPTEEYLCSGNADYTGICSRVFFGSATGDFTEQTTNAAYEALYNDPPSASVGNPYWRLPNQADIDGDGLQDILALNSGRWRSLGNGNFAMSPVQDSSQLCGLPIDFNGDGRSDCLRAEANVASQTLTISYGAASSGSLAQFNLNAGATNNFYAADGSGRQTVGVVVEDFDGDGRQDILRWGPTAATDNGIYLSNGDGSFRPRVAAGLGGLSKALQSADGTTSFVLGDFLGNGTVQILHMKDNPSAAGEKNQIYARSSGGAPGDVLYSVTSATGLISQVVGREPLSNSTRYVPERGTAQAAVAPVVDLQMPMYVITAVNQDTGVGTVTTDYLYKGLKAERGGRGLLGFREMRQQSPASDGNSLLTTATEYLQTYPYTGVAALTQTYLGSLSLSGAQRLSRTTNSYCDKTSASAPTAATAGTPPAPCATTAKVQRPYVYQTIEEGWDLGNSNLALPTITTTNTYNNAGDPLTITMQTSGTALGGLSQTFTKATTNTYFTDNTSGDNWILGRLQRATVQNTVPNSLPSITTSAGTSPNATARVGSGPPPAPASLPPGVLNAILQLLLDD